MTTDQKITLLQTAVHVIAAFSTTLLAAKLAATKPSRKVQENGTTRSNHGLWLKLSLLGAFVVAVNGSCIVYTLSSPLIEGKIAFALIAFSLGAMFFTLLLITLLLIQHLLGELLGDIFRRLCEFILETSFARTVAKLAETKKRRLKRAKPGGTPSEPQGDLPL